MKVDADAVAVDDDDDDEEPDALIDFTGTSVGYPTVIVTAALP